MGKYLALYLGSATDAEKSAAPIDSDTQAKGMAAWGAWMGSNAASIVDGGGPLGATKRIVLADTLLERFPGEEVEGIVAHELGHQVHGDIWRTIGFGTLAGFGLAGALAVAAPEAIERAREETGVTELGDEASLPMLALLTSVFGLVLMPLQAPT